MRTHTNHKIDLHPSEGKNGTEPLQRVKDMTPPKVAQRITDVGFYYHLRDGGEEIGPFTVEDEKNQELNQNTSNST